MIERKELVPRRGAARYHALTTTVSGCDLYRTLRKVGSVRGSGKTPGPLGAITIGSMAGTGRDPGRTSP